MRSRSASPPAHHPRGEDEDARYGRRRNRDHDEHRQKQPRHAPPPRWGRASQSPTPDPDPSHNPATSAPPEPAKLEPDFRPSGRLAEETNLVKGVVVKYNEPQDAHLLATGHAWRIYVFKGDEQVDERKLGGQSAYLVGRDRRVADIPVDHESCSKQHAVVQFRMVPAGGVGVCRPYLIDLDSANGTFVNGERIPTSRYYELRHKDMVRFGVSTREYVFISEAAVDE